MSHDSAQATAEWWADQVFGPRTDRDAEGLGLTDTADILYGATVAPVEYRAAFIAAVAEHVRAALTGLPAEHPVILRVDYQPTAEHWPEILAKAPIPDAAEYFPWKTATLTYRDRVEVRGEDVWRGPKPPA